MVATIPAKQDELIRLDHPEVLVIEGGPGTGERRGGAAPRHFRLEFKSRRHKVKESGGVVTRLAAATALTC